MRRTKEFAQVIEAKLSGSWTVSFTGAVVDSFFSTGPVLSSSVKQRLEPQHLLHSFIALLPFPTSLHLKSSFLHSVLGWQPAATMRASSLIWHFIYNNARYLWNKTSWKFMYSGHLLSDFCQTTSLFLLLVIQSIQFDKTLITVVRQAAAFTDRSDPPPAPFVLLFVSIMDQSFWHLSLWLIL